MSADPFSFSVSTDAPLDMRASNAPAVKASPARPPMLFSGVGGQTWGYGMPYGDMLGAGRLAGLLPGARLDYNREAGDIWRNSVFAICLGWASDNFPNAKIQVTRSVDGKDTAVPNHPLTRLFRRPNAGYSARSLWSAVLLSLKIDGNAYLMKARNMGGYGQTTALWWVPHWQMFPQWPTGPTTTYIDHYKYIVDGRVYELDPKNVVHIKDGLDPINTRMGLGRVKAQLRNIVGTNEADGYTASLLRNMGIPAVMFSPKGEFLIDESQAKEINRRWKLETGGENRGSPWVNSLAVVAEKLGLSPQELALDTIMDRPVANICASFRVSPMVVGLPDTQRTYSNYQEARKAAWEDCLIPTQDMIAEEGLQTQLLADFGDPETETVSWDRTKVPALQEGDDQRANRAVQLFTNMLGYRDECRDVVGMAPIDGGQEVWYSDVMGGPADPNAEDDPEEEPADDEESDEPDDDESSDNDDAIKAMRAAPKAGKASKRRGGATGGQGSRKKFEESKHPRDHGKFASKPGSGKDDHPLSQEEHRALQEYTDANYKHINATLRGKGEHGLHVGKSDVDSQVAILDRAIGRSKLAEDTTLYRGIDPKAFGGIDPKRLIGRTVPSSAYTSTSKSYDVADRPDFNKGYLLKISAPKGTRAATVETNRGEQEVILPRDTKLKITRVRKAGVNQHGIDTTVIHATIVH